MASKKIVVDLYYDIISAYSWLCFEQLSRHQNIWPNVSVRLRPLLLGTLISGSGNKAPFLVPSKGKYIIMDVTRYAKYLQIPLTIPGNFTELAFGMKTFQAMRFVAAVDHVFEHKHTEAISRTLFKRMFTTHSDIEQLDSLRDAGRDTGLNNDEIEKAIEAMKLEKVKAQLKMNSVEALELGSFGAPTMVAHTEDGPQLFVGNDRLELLAKEIGVRYAPPLLEFSKV
ncbi:Glutathione S-transferase kappa 1 [Halotydeus destructor]|nr:Glutathione S-transferase kappa 1 [Halotydeus destructor]